MDAVTHSTSGTLYGGRFQGLRLLKSGPGTATLLGRDVLNGVEVVIKTAEPSSIAPDARLRLEHEAKILGDLRSPSLTPVLAVGHQDGVVYCITPWVPGVTLRERLDRDRLTAREILIVGRSLSNALQQAHGRGVLHRDVKPSNVVVDIAIPLRHATLVDFGFARSECLSPAIRDIPVGSLAYLAPEQAGLLDRPVDERSDLYGLGILLFECAAGRLPFQADQIGDLLRHHLSTTPPALRTIGCDIPRALDEVIRRLLRKDPDDRYQTAEGLQADLVEIEDAMAAGAPNPVVVVGLRDRRRMLAEPAFVGRAEELATLDATLVRTTQGRGGLVLLGSESGGGKTRLIEEFAQRSLRSGAWVLRGQGMDQAAMRPFQVMEGVVQGVLDRLASDVEFFERVKSGLGDQLPAACQALPQLAGVLGATTQSLGPEAHGELRTLRALSGLLDTLGSGDRPVVVVLDDVQWADDLTLKLLDYWQRAGRANAAAALSHVLIVAAFRSEEVNADHMLRRLPAMTSLNLAPFTAPDLRRLAESMAGRLPDEAIEVVVRLSEGSPFMATAVLQGLVEIGGLMPRDGPHHGSRWVVNQPVMAEAQASRRAGVFLALRLARLPTEVLDVLSVGAVLGKEFEPRIAGALTRLAEKDVLHSCEEARKRHLIWTDSPGARCTFVHDKVREALLARLGEKERRALHRAAASTIEGEDNGRIFEIAYHYDAAGETERAFPYALQAAEVARERHALAIAERQYRIAERGVQAAVKDVQLRVRQGLGEVLMLLGRYDESRNMFEEVKTLVQTKEAGAEIDAKLGELAFKCGDMSGASGAIERGLQRLGESVPKGTALVWSVVREIAIQTLHTIFPRLFCNRRPLTQEKSRSELLIVRLYSRLAYVYWFQRGSVATIWAHLREINRAELYPPTRELGQAYTNHGVVMTLIPWFRRGILYARKGLAIRRSLHDIWGEANSLSFYGMVLYAASRYQESLEILKQAINQLQRTGDRWEENNAGYHVGFCLYRLGDLRGAVAASKKVYAQAIEIGEAHSLGVALDVWSRSSGGHVPPDLLQVELARPSDDAHTVAEVMQAEGMRLLYAANEPEKAECAFQRAIKFVDENGLRTEFITALPLWLAGARRSRAERLSCWTPEFRAVISGAYTAAKRGLGLSRRYRNNLPHAWRELGLLAAMRGKSRRAWKYFDESLAEAERQGARFECAQTLLARGRVGAALGWPQATEEVEAASSLLRALGANWVLGEMEPEDQKATVTPGLIDRFDAVLDVGRRIAAALSQEAVHNAIGEAALTLLRGDVCLVLDVAGSAVSGKRRVQVLAKFGLSSDAAYSQTLVDRAVETGRPVVSGDGTERDASESLVLSGARSVLCAPIAVRGRIVACFYVTHRHVGGLFGPDEERLAEFIATLAGAALENVEGLAEAESQLIANSAAGLAHAIKNPVAIMRAYVDLLRTSIGSGDSSAFPRYLATMDGAADRINELVRRLRRVPVDGCRKERVGLESLVRRAVDEVRPLFSEGGGYRIDIDVSPEAPRAVVADGEQVILALANVLANAGQSMPEGGLIRVEVRPGDRGSAMIAVSDQGPGISPEIQQRLFEPFLTTKPEGTGLGLWVCRKIVEEHHQGRITVAPAPGEGTTVVLALPIEDGAGLSRDSDASPE